MEKDLKIAKLLKKNQELKSQIKELKSRVEDDTIEITRWKDLYFSEKDRHYGRKSESDSIPNSIQLSLFDEMENTIESDTRKSDPNFDNKNDNQKKTIVKSYSRSKGNRASLTLPSNAPVADVYHDVEKTNCETCNAELTEIGEFIEEKITFVPARYVVVRHHRKQQRCLNCLPLEGTNKIVTAPMDNNLLTGTICEPSLLAHIIVHKMQFGLPLYRLEQKLVFPNKQNISRQLMSAWSITTYNKLKGLESAFERALNKATMWNMDETKLLNIHSDKKSKVQLQYDRDVLKIQEDGKKQKLLDDAIISMIKERYEQYQKENHNAMNCFMIVRSATNKDGSRGLVMFNYAEHRTNEYLGSFIGNYKGILQSDGLAGYSNAAEDKSFVHLGCLIHSRRSAKNVLRASSNNQLAKELVNLYNDIFKKEKELREEYRAGEYTEEEYLTVRKKELEPRFEALNSWLLDKKDSHILSPMMKKAINYPLKRWESLKRFMDYSFATSSNNEAERKVSNFVLGRKAFLFSNTVMGANSSAFYYSIVESCKALSIDPFLYITHILMNSGTAKTNEDWDNLLPSKVDLSKTQKYLEKIHSAIPNPERTEPYILRGKKKR